ncbi:hypothetical protein CLAFUW4_10940 [Fulvia fulva]|uniref:Uncharacterized protein n=1 Tax=Passalora fulva TaxID=5499 RepID=A0A9Q8URK2_PASFU|nr:uncharacterized protein CLAFUR5_09982 [Fulvia fulva]KAK4619866.1 hypothetical protein CLAFUR4_10945 [Fulvia fulva]KAK4620910.1 hypothetical protein CLAFUR0_10952 [Fulvia fulva]UJO19838.1 hypothetical protein CLAFUR5_09982 [Fulvia fulva]WPV17063.1 hypothetical protein CLAFUW4_10940 [Fulvia fulva]WPV32437.1 hypothetical protein CLAFUW7_10938 [Fulvia fulva]
MESFEAIMEWIERKSVLAGGSMRHMNVVIHDEDPGDQKEGERFELKEEQKKEKGKWREKVTKVCGIQ